MPLDPVPASLVPFFTRGGIRGVLNVAGEYGTGLEFINQIRRYYKQPTGMSQKEYYGNLSYLSQTAKAALQAGQDLSGLDVNSPIPDSLIPKNFFLRNPDPLSSNYMVQVEYTSRDTNTGATRTDEGIYWANELDTPESILNYVTSKILELLRAINRNVRNGALYELVLGTIRIVAALRR